MTMFEIYQIAVANANAQHPERRDKVWLEAFDREMEKAVANVIDADRLEMVRIANIIKYGRE